MKQRRIPANGSVFLVPLPTSGYGTGVLVRADGKGRAYGVFFGPRVANAKDVAIEKLKPDEAISRCRFGDHGLYTKRWPVIGTIPNWDIHQWALPKFSRPHDSLGKCYLTEYDDTLNLLSEVIVDVVDGSGMPEDAQYGSGVVEIKLDKLLI